MPRTAYTADGQAVFVKTTQPLPVVNTVLSLEAMQALNEIVIQLKFLNAQIGECFQTGIELEDIEND